MLLYLGVMGWAIGGVGGRDRFDGYGQHALSQHAVGAGALSHLLRDGRRPDDPRHGVPPGHRSVEAAGKPRAITRAIVTTVGVGGYGFLLMFYLAGVAGVPRRYATYPAEVAQGVMLREDLA